jgi:N-hydroxyarylamine O-acetyltransferase
MSTAPALDLAAYFDRIGFTAAATASLETLRAIHLRHALAIPFENLNPLLGWPVQLDRAALEDKLIHNRRGGYCYEQNLLFRHALEQIGFRVTGLAARVMWSVPDGVVLPRTHMLLRVDVDGQPHIADVGFGGLTLTSPLRLEAETEQSTPHEMFRLIVEDGEWIMQAKLGESWRSLYRFTTEPQMHADYEMANWYVSRHPKSRFVNGLIAARAASNGRHALFNTEYAVHHLNGRTERRALNSAAEIREVLEGPMGIRLPAAAELDAALNRITQIRG